MIPRIIHQTWKTADIPARFRDMAASWQRRNPGWEYHLWTDEDLEGMVAEHYPELLSLYRGYSGGVQRADAARYMLLHKFGGVYADIDTTCLDSFEPLVTERRLVLSQEPSEQNESHCISRGLDQLLFNGTIAGPAGHPFWSRIFQTLPLTKDARDTLDRTGPLMLSGCVQKYKFPEQLAFHSCHLFNERTSRGELSRDTVFGPYSRLRLSEHHWAGTWFTVPVRTRRQNVKKALRQIRYRLTRGRQLSFSEAEQSIDCQLLSQPLPRDIALRSQRIACLVPVRDAESHLERCLGLIRRLDHPLENISVTFCEGDSKDGTKQRIRELVAEHRHLFREMRVVHVNVGTEFPHDRRWLRQLQRSRRAGLARVRNKLIDAGLSPEDDWALWIDVDLTDYAPDVLTRLLEQREKLVVPNCVFEPGGKSFDLNSFITVNNAKDHTYYKFIKRGLYQPNGDSIRRLHLHDVRYLDQVPLNGVGGTMMLVHASVHRAGVRFPEEPYRDLIETEGFGQLARDLGVTPLGLPNIEIIHPRC